MVFFFPSHKWAFPNLWDLLKSCHKSSIQSFRASLGFEACAFCMLQLASYPIITINIVLRSNYSSCSNTLTFPLWNPELRPVTYNHLESLAGQYISLSQKIINPAEMMAHHLTKRSCWAPTSCAATAPSPTTVSSSVTWPSQRQQIVTWNREKHPHNLWGRSNQRKWGGTYSKWEAVRMRNTFLFWPMLQQQATQEEIKQMKAFWNWETTEIN